MTSYPLGFRIAQAIGLAGAAWLSGKLPLCFFLHIVKSYMENSIPINNKRISRETW